MRRWILALLMLCMLCGCGEDGADGVVTGDEVSVVGLTAEENAGTVEAVTEGEFGEEAVLTEGEIGEESALTEGEIGEEAAAGEVGSEAESEAEEAISLPEAVKSNIGGEEAGAILAEMAEIAVEYGVSVSYISGDGSFYCAIDGERLYRSASTVKAIYCQYLVSAGVELERTLLFEAQEERTSISGMLTADRRGECFTVGELIECALVHSDNMAYRVLFEEFGVEGFNGWVSELGLAGLAFPSGDYEFFDVDAVSLSGGMLEILRDGRLIETMKGAEFKLLALGSEYEVASKYGYEGGTKGYHDTGIILAPAPYVLTVMSSIDANRSDAAMPFYEITRRCDRLNRLLFGEDQAGNL